MTNGIITEPKQNRDKLHDDPTVDDMLNDDLIREHYRNNRILQPKITRAAELLKREPNRLVRVTTLRTAVDAILADEGKGRVNVFVSYKMKDKEDARQIVDALSELTRGRLKITWADAFTGSDLLHEKIRNAVLEAHWFILILPDPSDDWDWCLFETGLFRGSMHSNRLNKVFCLHHFANNQPEQINEFLSVVARPDDPSAISKMLSTICHEEDFFPGMGKLCASVTPSEISKAATTINKVIFPPQRKKQRTRKRFEPFVRIRWNVPEGQDIENSSPEDIEKLLNDAAFDWRSDEDPGTNDDGRGIFGWTDQPLTWGRLVSDVMKPGMDRRWIEELCSAIKQAAMGRAFIPIQATFQAANQKKSMYRPILYGAEKSVDGSIAAFLIVFVTDVGGTATDTTKIPINGYAELISSIRLGYRFRWEVVEPFRNLRDTRDVMALKETMDRVMGESKSRGQHKLEELANFFGDKHDRVDELYGIFVNTLGEISKAIEQKDTQGIARILTNFAPANQEYLTLSTAAFAKMNEKIFNEMTALG